MKTIFLFFSIAILNNSLNAQNDTLIVCYKDSEFTSSMLYPKLENDPNAKLTFPYNGGASYRYTKKVGQFERDIRFHFLSWSLEGPWPYFDYKLIHKELVPESKLIKNAWFQNNSYSEIVKTFVKNDPVVYLIDERYNKGDSVYLVRVIFSITGLE